MMEKAGLSPLSTDGNGFGLWGVAVAVLALLALAIGGGDAPMAENTPLSAPSDGGTRME